MEHRAWSIHLRQPPSLKHPSSLKFTRPWRRQRRPGLRRTRWRSRSYGGQDGEENPGVLDAGQPARGCNSTSPYDAFRKWPHMRSSAPGLTYRNHKLQIMGAGNRFAKKSLTWKSAAAERCPLVCLLWQSFCRFHLLRPFSMVVQKQIVHLYMPPTPQITSFLPTFISRKDERNAFRKASRLASQLS